MKPRTPKPKVVDLHTSKRFQRLRKHLIEDDTAWPVVVGNRIYMPNSLDVPETLYSVSSTENVAELLDQYSIGFGGTCSPCVDAVMVTELLAQVPRKIDPRAFVVSGGVYGVDQAAHMGALDKDGRTVAVLANPPDYGIHPYVPERLYLEHSIRTRGGVLLSAYDSFTDDRTERLKERDGIISWLSDVFVVVECSTTSETLDTAIRAKLQGNHVVAIDWDMLQKIWDHEPRNREGNNYLIEHGHAQSFPFSSMKITDPGFEMSFRTLLEEWWFHRRLISVPMR